MDTKSWHARPTWIHVRHEWTMRMAQRLHNTSRCFPRMAVAVLLFAAAPYITSKFLCVAQLGYQHNDDDKQASQSSTSLPSWNPITIVDRKTNDPVASSLVGNQAHDLYGWSVALSRDGSTLAIGAIDSDPRGISAAGQLSIYQLIPLPRLQNHDNANEKLKNVTSSSSSAYHLQPSVVVAGTQSSEYLGYSVSLSKDGSVVAFGSPGHDQDAGRVSVYELVVDDSTFGMMWRPKGQDIGLVSVGDDPQTVKGAQLGHVVGLSDDGNIIVTGAPYYDHHRGLVLVMHFNDTTHKWDRPQRLLGDLIPNVQQSGRTGVQFGYSIAISGSAGILVVGAKNHPGRQYLKERKEDQNQNAKTMQFTKGQIQVFRQDGDMNKWILAARPMYGLKMGDYFGFALSISVDGSILAVGSPYYDSFLDTKKRATKKDAGLVQIYRLVVSNQRHDDYDLLPLGQNLEGGHEADCFGYSIALSDTGHRIAVGARQANELAGQVQVFDLAPTQIKSDDDDDNSGHCDDNRSYYWRPSNSTINGENQRDQSGFSLSLAGDGNLLVIGSPYHDVTERATAATCSSDENSSTKLKPNAGQARVFYSTPSVSTGRIMAHQAQAKARAD